MSFALVIFGLIVIIMIHEGGHFLMARAVGIRATKFYLFFPPKLFAVKRGDVEYGVGMIPLGGFVRLPGMFAPDGPSLATRLNYDVSRTVAGLDDAEAAADLGTALRLISSAATPEMLEMRLRDLDAAVASIAAAHPEPAGERSIESAVAWQRSLTKFRNRIRNARDDVHPSAYWRASLGRRMAVIAAGPGANIILGFGILWITAMFLSPVYSFQWRVAGTNPGSPAQQAGLNAGDEIVMWNGARPGTTAEQGTAFRSRIAAGHGKPVKLTVRRGGVLITKRIVPATTKSGDKLIGLSAQARETFRHYDRKNPISSFGVAARATTSTTTSILEGMRRTVDPQHIDEVGTVVGVVKVAPQVEKARAILPFLGGLSIAIAIFNLLPILPLDGGHLAFGIVEWFRRGRPVSRMVMERASVIGLALMLGLFFIGLRNDLGFGG